ncbi:MAG: glutamate synthase-related protein [Syntrophobacteraceae bacterium]|jgi:glutamate synthase domain-containing protein 2/formylmethanofuran dehydrogenase subunit C|nr:glutamate synthase-related protein [Syntrophobacteraceae bacterium]
MAIIDLSKMSIRTANEVIKGYGANHLDVEIINPDARHYIAVGLANPIRLKIRGSAGYFCGGLSDGPAIEVEKNVSWGVGDNMLGGSIVVGGNAGAIAGVALRGGEIVIRGNMGSRAGQVMKKGVLCCGGSSSFMAGYMMYGGRMIILGSSGHKVGEDMAGGEIFVGGRIDSLGHDAMECDSEPEEIESIRELLDRYGIAFHGGFRKIVCAGKGLRYGAPEPRGASISFPEFSGLGAGIWNARVQEDIRVKSAIGRYRVRGYGAARHIPHFGDLAFKADLSRAGEDPEALSRVNLRTFIGGKHGGRALDLSMPVLIAPMSYGAVSGPMKAALAMASRLSGICDNTGEGGMYSVERAEARQLIAQCLSGRLGWNIHDMKRADAIELYISQGAKPGLGGQLMASKLTPEIAEMRGIPAGMDLRSPSRHPDVLGGDDLIMKIEELREAVGWRLPVGLKLGAGRTRDDIKIALKDCLDFVELDGLQGGTGAGASEVLEYVGIPTLSAIMEAMDGLAELDARGRLPVVLMGGIQNGVDAAKSIALGAAAVGLGTGMLVAAGCIGCMRCSTGQCPVGIATQDPELVRKFDVEAMALRMHRYLESIRWQLAAVVHGLGYSDVGQLRRDDLVALTPEAAAMTRLPHAPEYRERDSRFIAASRGFRRTDSETGSASFDRGARAVIQAMTRAEAGDASLQRGMLEAVLAPRENPFPGDRPARLDDLVFLSAALTRLVIDPYREACSTRTRIGRTEGIGSLPEGAPFLDLEQPFFLTGFDGAPENVRQAVAMALAATGCGYIGRSPLPSADSGSVPGPGGAAFPWLQLVLPGDVPSSDAAGLIYGGQSLPSPSVHPNPGLSSPAMGGEIEDRSFSTDASGWPAPPTRLKPHQLLGIVIGHGVLDPALNLALDHGLDVILLDSSGGAWNPWVELADEPRWTVIRDALRILREVGREEEIPLIHFGGMRSGTDVAKILALNGQACAFGVAAGLALGGVVEGGGLRFDPAASPEELSLALVNWIQGTSQETAIIARCTGKTRVHNLEPEDMRSISLAAREAFDIPLASGQEPRASF